MKQHITEDQLYSLSQEGKQKLRDWWRDQPEQEKFLTKTHHADGALPLLSIGQMIEFLDDNKQRPDLLAPSPIDKQLNGWRVETMTMRSNNYNEPCEALWEACKQVLEEKK